jgi:hypothetical protein
VDRVHDAWAGRRGSGPWWTEVARTRLHDGALLEHCAWALGLASAHRRLWRGRAGQGGAGGVLTEARAATERWCNGEEDRWWLELIARVKEGARELGSEGERGSEGQGCSGV